MSASALVNITINGRAIQARAGQTVLEAAATAGIRIPALCNDPHLKPEGACRVCLVEIEKQRTLQPACTFPVFEGMVVRTESEKAVASRKFALQMIFSERSHYCMFCSKSGSNGQTDCQLQQMAYDYGLTHWLYPPNYKADWPVDASRKYFVMDHARCILCRRCVRACAQIAANHTLGLTQRGARTMICADDDVPFGESSCVSCGTCLQVCPTGALSDRRSAFFGHEADAQRIQATCMSCAVGCGTEALVRDNQLLRIEGNWNGNSGGLLCVTGRFEALEPKPPRIMWPLIREDGRQIQTSWDKALMEIARQFRESRRVAGLISPRTTNECLAAFACFFHEVLESNEVALLYGDVPPLDLGEQASLQDVASSDCIAVIGGDVLEDHKVVGYLIKRACDNGARLIVVNDRNTGLDPYAQVHLHLEDISSGDESPFEQLRTTYHLRASGIAQLRAALEAAERPVLLCSAGLTTTVYAALRALPSKVKFLPLVTGTNAVGAARLGITARPVHGDSLYILLGDEIPRDMPFPERQFTVVHAAYESEWTRSADVVLPALTTAEYKGHIVNMEGRSIAIAPLVAAPSSTLPAWEMLLRLSVRMGYEMSYEEINEISTAV